MKTVKGSFGKAASSVAALDPMVVLTLAGTAFDQSIDFRFEDYSCGR